MNGTTRILGIDPGSRVTGYGVIDFDGASSRYVASGCIQTTGDDFAGRLKIIFDGVSRVCAEFGPAQIAVERVFVMRNADSALKLGQARSAAICATFGRPVELFEYAAREVKQAVVGRGGADKRQVQHMVTALLALPEKPAADAADALAVALCHAHSRPLAIRLSASLRGVATG